MLAVDVAAEPIARGRDRAAAAGLNNIEFLCADATTDLPHQSFDAVICVFGVFFAADIPAFIGELWSHVRPGGQLAITTWGPDLFEPANTVFWEAVAAEDHHGFNPWDDVTDQLSCTVVGHLRARMITELTTNVVYATATRPALRDCRPLLHPLSGDCVGPAVRCGHTSEFNGNNPSASWYCVAAGRQQAP